MKIIKLGAKYKDIITGYEGTAVCRTEWLHGCGRVSLQMPGLDKDNKPYELQTFDEMQLELVADTAHVPDRKTGGPRPKVETRR